RLEAFLPQCRSIAIDALPRFRHFHDISVDDIESECLLVIWRRRLTFDPSRKAAFSTWAHDQCESAVNNMHTTRAKTRNRVKTPRITGRVEELELVAK